ncbi:MAG: hypothetical protein R2838_10285 [Caldilineaceae bacterium]
MELYYPYGINGRVQDAGFNEIGFPFLYGTRGSKTDPVVRML